MNDIITIQNVRGYIDAQNTVWINAEDAARGLGFVEVKKDRVATNGDTYEAIRWARVNEYLQSFGFSQKVAKDDFIPENMFYRLAMKAKNAVAEAFQAKVADEILPTIRKTGSYSIERKSYTPVADALADVRKTADEIQNLIDGVKRGIAITSAVASIEQKHDVSLGFVKELLPPAEHETGYMNPTEIGKRLGGIPPRTVNKMLAAKGTEYRQGNSWRLTEEGKEYGEEIPYTRNGHSGYQIRWSERIMELFEEEEATA